MSLLVTLLPITVALAQPRVFEPEDLLQARQLGGLTASPEGDRLVFAVHSADREANRKRSDVWIVDTDGSTVQLTTHPEADHTPQWGAEGQVFFLSDRQGSTQVWQIDSHGGEAAQVTDLPVDLGDLLVAPDGRTAVVSALLHPDCDTLACSAERQAVQDADPSTGQVYDRLMVRHWSGWRDERQRRLVAIDLATGEATAILTRDLDAEVPFGGRMDVTFTPDSRVVVFAARAAHEQAWTTSFALYAVPADGSAPPQKFTDDPAWSRAPVFSPDGRTLAYRAMREPGYEADRFRVVLRSWEHDLDGGLSVTAGPARWLTEDWDHTARSVAWSRNGATLFVHSDDEGGRSLFAVDPRSGRATLRHQGGTVNEPVVLDRAIAFRHDTVQRPPEIFVLRDRARSAVQITHFHDEWVDGLAATPATPFTFTGADGDTVHGMWMEPPHRDAEASYPVLLLVHGGPQSTLADRFHSRMSARVFASAGYAVVMIDFHGSVGYGQAFTDRITGDWGGAPLVDLDLGLEHALGANPWMDGDRVGALGASYGGYMMFWLASQRPDRFRCLVAHAGVFSPRQLWFDTEELWFVEHDMVGPPWADASTYHLHDPSQHVASWRTPMLVVQGGKDFRVTESHSLSAFNALQRLGVESRLLYFPDESHWVNKPHNVLQWHDEVLGWLGRYLEP